MNLIILAHISDDDIITMEDIIILISESLSNREKIKLSATCRAINMLKGKFVYYDKVDAELVALLPYDFRFVTHIAATAKIPAKTTHLQFHEYFDEHVRVPFGVTHVKFGWSFRQDLTNYLPLSVTHLQFCSLFNKSLRGCLPKSITFLSMGGSFNQSIDNCLHFGITHLKLSSSFNKSIANCIPASVTHLLFGRLFNQPIKGNIPSSVTHLGFDRYFSYPVKDIIPSSVTHLVLHHSYPHFAPQDIDVMYNCDPSNVGWFNVW